jgi:hypothetical protein
MPNVVVDLSARSRHIREEPWHLHFWELEPDEVIDFLREPRAKLGEIGIELPESCRIETSIENHDWIARETSVSRERPDGGAPPPRPIVICGIGRGNAAADVYRISMYGHRVEDVGRYEKRLLHAPEAEEAEGGRRSH